MSEAIVDNSGGAVTPEPQATTVETQVQETQVQETQIQETPTFDHASASRDERRSRLESFFLPQETAAAQQTIPVETQTPQATQQQEEWLNNEALDKFKNPDGSLNYQALAKSYVNAQSKIGEQGNKMGEQNRQLQELAARLSQLEQGIAQPQAIQPQQTVPEAPKEFNQDEWFDKFYSNPTEALKDLLGGTVKEMIDPLTPIIQEHEFNQQKAFWEQKVSDVASKYSDFDQYRPQVAEMLKEMPDSFLDLDNSIEITYLMAKGKASEAEPKTSVGDLLKNQDFLKMLADNPEVQKTVLKSYGQQISSEPKPPTVGGHLGTMTPSTPPPEIKSVKDATRAFRARLEGGRT